MQLLACGPIGARFDSGFRGLFDATGCRAVSNRQLHAPLLGRIVATEPELRGCVQHPI